MIRGRSSVFRDQSSVFRVCPNVCREQLDTFGASRIRTMADGVVARVV